MIKATLKKKPVLNTNSQPVDENAALHLADQLEAVDAAQEIAVSPEATSAAASPLPAPAIVLPADVGGGMEGEFTLSDFSIPGLFIVAGSGQLAQRFSPGSLIYNDEQLFSAQEIQPNKPLFRFVAVSLRKSFRENLSQEEAASGVRPRLVQTVEQVRDLGSTTEWGPNSEKPGFSPSARFLLLMEQPEGFKSHFFFLKAGDKLFAPTTFSASNTAYRYFAKPIMTRVAMSNIPLDSVWFNFSINRVKSGNFNVTVPCASVSAGAVPAEVRQLAERFRMTSGNQTAED